MLPRGRLLKHKQGKVVSEERTLVEKIKTLMEMNLSTKEERMLSTSWIAETMIGAREGSRLDPASCWKTISKIVNWNICRFTGAVCCDD